jgi:hypothetical protein
MKVVTFFNPPAEQRPKLIYTKFGTWSVLPSVIIIKAYNVDLWSVDFVGLKRPMLPVTKPCRSCNCAKFMPTWLAPNNRNELS